MLISLEARKFKMSDEGNFLGTADQVQAGINHTGACKTNLFILRLAILKDIPNYSRSVSPAFQLPGCAS